MSFLLICAVLASCIPLSFSFMLDGQPGNIQEIANELGKLQSEVAALKEMIQELQETCPSCAVSRKQSSPAFMASLSMFVTCTVDAPLVFDREQLDTRQAYDTRHGLFRAPVNGTYMFTATIAAQPNQWFHVKFVRNSLSDEIDYLFSDNGHSGWNERSTTIVVKLAAGDDVWLACTMPSNITGGNSGMEHDYHSHFSGFFIDAF